jgi:hypothetical protein
VLLLLLRRLLQRPLLLPRIHGQVLLALPGAGGGARRVCSSTAATQACQQHFT